MKSIQLADDEIHAVMQYHARCISESVTSDRIERLRYLDKRLNAKKEEIEEKKDTF